MCWELHNSQHVLLTTGVLLDNNSIGKELNTVHSGMFENTLVQKSIWTKYQK